MKGILGILMVIAVICPPGAYARGITVVNKDGGNECATSVEDLAVCLEKIDGFSASVRYEVALPMATDDVVYDVEIASDCNRSDTLCGMDYLVRWQLPRAESKAEGFLAYFNGHHYRYRDHRLQEYHFEWDSIPFQTAGGGVQRNGQFVDLLPSSIARELRTMLRDTAFTVSFSGDTVMEGNHVAMVCATQTVNGFCGRNYRLIADRSTGLPLNVWNEYNPGQISEQGVEAAYSYERSPQLKAVASEEELMGMYPEVFEKFRESNYRIENMRGLPLPSFSLPTVTGERYTRHRGDSFNAPTVVALIDPAVETSVETVKALREAVASMPMQVDLILAFTGSNIDTVESLTGAAGMGEALLISAKSLARDCGTSVFPTILLVGSGGNVENVILGFNNSLSQDVIQSLALIR
jgi:hypothetical protein